MTVYTRSITYEELVCANRAVLSLKPISVAGGTDSCAWAFRSRSSKVGVSNVRVGSRHLLHEMTSRSRQVRSRGMPEYLSHIAAAPISVTLSTSRWRERECVCV
jgi:hypothetical protein